MNPDLQRLIQLQTLETELQTLRRTVDTEAAQRQALHDTLDASRAVVDQVHQRLTDNQNERRLLEKDLAQLQGRLSKYKDQLMEVKTNKEYAAVQSEIATATAEVQRIEDRILDIMMTADDISAELKKAQDAMAQQQAEVGSAEKRLAADVDAARQRLTVAGQERDQLAQALPRSTLQMFETIASHRGAAVVEAKGGHCSVCHVRLRPQIYQEIRRNEAILQCDSCQRILYFVPPKADASAQSAAQ